MAAAAAMIAASPPPVRRQPIEPVPDIVIRPPRQRTSLPAVIAPKSPRQWMGLSPMAAIGVVAIGVLLAVGIYVFRNEIAARVPSEWRSMLSQRA